MMKINDCRLLVFHNGTHADNMYMHVTFTHNIHTVASPRFSVRFRRWVNLSSSGAANILKLILLKWVRHNWARKSLSSQLVIPGKSALESFWRFCLELLKKFSHRLQSNRHAVHLLAVTWFDAGANMYPCFSKACPEQRWWAPLAFWPLVSAV